LGSILHDFLALKRSCSAAQREKTLDKQLHGLIEQLAVKQVLPSLVFNREKLIDNGWLISV